LNHLSRNDHSGPPDNIDVPDYEVDSLAKLEKKIDPSFSLEATLEE